MGHGDGVCVCVEVGEGGAGWRWLGVVSTQMDSTIYTLVINLDQMPKCYQNFNRLKRVKESR